MEVQSPLVGRDSYIMVPSIIGTKKLITIGQPQMAGPSLTHTEILLTSHNELGLGLPMLACLLLKSILKLAVFSPVINYLSMKLEQLILESQ